MPINNPLLPLFNNLFITIGGIETSLIFHEKIDLPYFAAFDLLKSQKGKDILFRQYQSYAKLAIKHKVNFLMESPTWRASKDWGQKLGYTSASLEQINLDAIQLLNEVRNQYISLPTKILIAGSIGPRGDAYHVNQKMSVQEAFHYHNAQIKAFSEASVDLITAATVAYVEEAIGMVKAANEKCLPIIMSFTVETDGKLPSGDTLKTAIENVDLATNNAPIAYMINCAHPNHFNHLLQHPEPWHERLNGILANASTKSHAELEEMSELDEGDPFELSQHYSNLKKLLKNLNIVGGCCGTNEKHIDAICETLAFC